MLLPNARKRAAESTGEADTTTLKVHDPVSCAASVAVHVTVEVPDGKTVPLAGVHFTVTGWLPPLTVGGGYDTVVGLPPDD
jgi:hypothetical protein